jgi:hypothetical protein
MLTALSVLLSIVLVAGAACLLGRLRPNKLRTLELESRRRMAEETRLAEWRVGRAARSAFEQMLAEARRHV